MEHVRSVSGRPVRWLTLTGCLTLISVIGVSWTLDHISLSPPARLALALVPVALWAGAIAFLVVALRSVDELQRRIQLEALAIAFPAAMLLGMLVEYLQKAGFAQGLAVGDVWPAMFLLYVPAVLFAHWRYR
ncbi:MAG TPA: hypothetical protein VFH11_14825 [Gemmatimonadota bacterium]|nr:hypothetical protein [Gemmatimonadota bacterium]